MAEELKKRCEDAIKAAEICISSGSGDERSVTAVENARRALEKDLELLTKAIDTKLYEEGARMRLDDMLDSRREEPQGDDGNGQGSDDSSPDDI